MAWAKNNNALASVAAVSLLAIAVSLGVAACTTTRAADQEKASRPATTQAVDVVPLRVGSISQVLSYTGDVAPKAQVALVPKVAGRIEELRIDVGSAVQEGAVIAVLDHAALDAQVRQAEAALAVAQAKLASVEAGPRTEVIATAQANLDAAKQKLASFTKGPRAEQVAQAEANLRAAEAKLKQLNNGPTPEQRRAAQMNVEGAKVNLHATNVQKDGDCAPYKPVYLCDASKAAAIAAAYGVDAAQAQYDALVAPPTAEQLAQAQAAVDAAREQYHLAQNPYTDQDIAQLQDAVKVAEEQLKLAQNPFTAQDLDAARAGVDQAAAAVDQAKLQLKEAYITAPISGVISEKLADIGNMASPQAPLVSITGQDVEVQVAIEEARVGLVSAGQPVSLTVASQPGQVFSGTVSSVAPTVDPRTRTVLVKITPDETGGMLKPGMFAQAQIAVAQHESALLMPKEALLQRDGKQVAFVVRDGFARMLPIKVGLSNERDVEVVEGLAGGDAVVVSPLADLIDGTPVAAERK